MKSFRNLLHLRNNKKKKKEKKKPEKKKKKHTWTHPTPRYWPSTFRLMVDRGKGHVTGRRVCAFVCFCFCFLNGRVSLTPLEVCFRSYVPLPCVCCLELCASSELMIKSGDNFVGGKGCYHWYSNRSVVQAVRATWLFIDVTCTWECQKSFQ